MGTWVVQKLEYQHFAGPGNIAPEVHIDLLPSDKPRLGGMRGLDGALEIKNRKLNQFQSPRNPSGFLSPITILGLWPGRCELLHREADFRRDPRAHGHELNDGGAIDFAGGRCVYVTPARVGCVAWLGGARVEAIAA